MSRSRILNRRDFLKIGGTGLACAALLGAARPALGQTSGGSMVSAHSLGISPENDGVTNRENLVAALRYSKKKVSFPSGDYLIDNSKSEPGRGLNGGGVINIDYFEGELVMEEGARFVFTDNARRGIVFHEGTGTKFRGLSTAFEEQPPVRVAPRECVAFHHMDDVVVEDANVDGSASAGLLFWRCVRPSVSGAEIKNTMADGLHFANCQDAKAVDIVTNNTGDDGLAFVDYDGDMEYSGGYARNIRVTDSKARGISVVGQKGVTVEDFFIDGTNASAFLCAHDAYWETRVPGEVVVRDGEIHNAGTVSDPAGKTGNNFGVEIDAVDAVKFEDVAVFSSAGRGVSAYGKREVNGRTTKGEVRLAGVEVSGGRGAGFDLQSGVYDIQNAVARETDGPGFAISSSQIAEYGSMTAVNVSKKNDLRRAFWFERNERVEGTRLNVVDDQPNPTGFKVITYRDKGGSLGEIHDKVSNGEVRLENQAGLDASVESGASEPDTSEPDTSEPDTSEPDTSEPNEPARPSSKVLRRRRLQRLRRRRLRLRRARRKR